MSFIVVLVYKSKLKYFVSLLCLFIIYYACKAKFALIAMPSALIVGFFTRRLIIKDIQPLVIFSLFILSLFVLNAHSILNYTYFLISKNTTTYLDTATFVTRFCFLFGSVEDMGKYPVGSGFGLNIELFRDNVLTSILLGEKYGLNVSEIRNYLSSSENFGSKETLSFFLSSFGFIGFYIYIKHFLYLFNLKYQYRYICKTLLLFIFFETFISISIILPIGILPIIYSRMALNEYRR
jgi:hypothetical protein